MYFQGLPGFKVGGNYGDRTREGRRPRSGRGAKRRVGGVWGGSPDPNPRILVHIFDRTVVYGSVLFWKETWCETRQKPHLGKCTDI
jgi:hypothetical protein